MQSTHVISRFLMKGAPPEILIIFYWLLVLNNSCNPTSFGFDAHDLVVVESYRCIYEGVFREPCIYKYMNTRYICVFIIIHWHFFPLWIRCKRSTLICYRTLQHVHFDSTKFLELEFSSQGSLTNETPHPHFTFTFKIENDFKDVFIHMM